MVILRLSNARDRPCGLLVGISGASSALHGFVLLEVAGGFGVDVSIDESFRRLLAMLARGLRT